MAQDAERWMVTAAGLMRCKEIDIAVSGPTQELLSAQVTSRRNGTTSSLRAALPGSSGTAKRLRWLHACSPAPGLLPQEVGAGLEEEDPNHQALQVDC